MTIGQLIESLMGKACILHGGFGNCTAYTNNGTKHESFGSVLTEYGYHSSGTEVLYNGMTGEQIKSDIYIGPTYYMRLKQMVKDKINYRSQGPRTQLTRQTVQGRANDGGLRVGEMERDGILGHGAAHFLNESLMVRGDEYYMAVCNKSGMIAIYNQNQNLFMSPMVDGPIQYSGGLTDAGTTADDTGTTGASVVHMTKFGRSFSIVRIPYCLKLLMQELLVMNVQMRIITEENIDQLPSMSYSKNIYKVLKDNKGAMGVDDIIERNRLAAGLKPREKPSATTTEQGKAQGGEEEESAIGSRMYLPSRSEEQDIAGTAAAAAAASDVGTTEGSFDPDLQPEDIIPGLLVIDSFRIRNLGWRFVVKPESMKEIMGSMERRRPLKSTDINSEDLVLESIILDKNGQPTERWTISGRQWVGDYPTRYPDGWLSEMLVYPDDTPIPPFRMVEELRKIRKPLNWVLALISLMERYSRQKLRLRTEAENVAMTENVRKIEINTQESERVSSEIERAKREGNVAEEERLKVQMTRLMDERSQLDSIRREMEGNPDDAPPVNPATPGYTSFNSPTPSPTSGRDEDAVSQVRGAVASFNAKMLDKYGQNDEEIPEGYTPRTPSSPGYTSMFDDEGQQGGGGGRRPSRQGGKYIPQIPMGVLDNYLTAKYGQTGAGVSAAGSAIGSQMTGVSGNMAAPSLPTMNIPIVATMPMAGMMPIQQGGALLQQPQQSQQQQQQQTGGNAAGGAVGGGTGPIPNAQGVKTFSIKL